MASASSVAYWSANACERASASVMRSRNSSCERVHIAIGSKASNGLVCLVSVVVFGFVVFVMSPP